MVNVPDVVEATPRLKVPLVIERVPGIVTSPELSHDTDDDAKLPEEL
jgi:hypothetical protein